MAEHTPGPWVRHRVFPNYVVPESHDERPVGFADNPQLNRNHYAGVLFEHSPFNVLSTEERSANTELAAAAPELLAALEQALAVLGSDEMRLACDLAALHGMPYRGPTVDRAAMRNLIAKARGEDDPT